MRPGLYRWGSWAAILGIALATLVPLGVVPGRFGNRLDPADILVNLVLYFPLGVVLGLERKPWTRIALVALLISGPIEMLQGTVISGRRGSLVDVGANISGALLGRMWLGAPVAVLAAPLLAWLASGLALRPYPPATPQWWGQWAHHFEGTEPFQGSILAVRLLSRPIPDGPLDSTAALVREARQGGLTLEVKLLAGGVTRRLTHLAGVSDGAGHVVIGIEQTGARLQLSWNSLGASIGLRRPRYNVEGALTAAPGQPLTIRAEVTTSRATVRVEGNGGRLQEALRLTPMAGWRSLIPTRGFPGAAQRLLGLTWTLCCLGYVLIAIRLVAYRRRASC
jgi:VanZ family protein